MGLLRTPPLINGILLLLAAVFMFSCSKQDYRAAVERYDAAMTAPVADYVVAGRHQQRVGSGKGRHTEYMLELRQFEAQPLAPPTTVLRVSDDVYERSSNGAHWRARVVAGQPLFDPDESRVEIERNNMMLLGAALFALAGVVIVVLARRRQ